MIYIKILKSIILIVVYGNFFLFSNYSNASQNIKIIVKIDNSIITSEDINYESSYLIALNENLNKLKKKEVYEIAKESLIKEKIKKKEIQKYIDIQNFDNDKLVNEVIKNIYIKLGFETNSEFEIYLNTFELSLEEVREKLNVEMVWNQLISAKFKDKINIDENKIRKKIQEEKINYQNLIEYDLSEIIFSAKNIKDLNTKTKEIKEAISNTGFETAANKFSISDTANFGGNIGKVNENQLSKTIRNELQKININDYTNPINVGNNFLIIKINEKNFIDLKLDEKEILNRMINIEKKRQYENFSLIYYNKIKLNSQINEF
jgi:peptidyl-prolyl cis-trans isomerase SurA